MDSRPPTTAGDLLSGEADDLRPRDVARIRGWNGVRAWRWMKRLHMKHGAKFVRETGAKRRSLVISRHALAVLIQEGRGPIDPRVVAMLNGVERRLVDRVSELEKRTDVHARALAKVHLL